MNRAEQFVKTRARSRTPFSCSFTAKSYLKAADDKADAGLKLGIMFSAVNIVLDLLVLVFLLKAGFGYFVSLTVWFGYFMLLMVPCIVGRSLQRTAA